MTAYSKSIAESRSTSDSTSRILSNRRAFGETGGTSDSPSRISSYLRGATDEISQQLVPSPYLVPSPMLWGIGVTIGDSVQRTVGYFRGEFDSLTLLGSTHRVFGSHRIEVDSSSTTDILKGNQRKIVNISETLSPSSSIIRRFGSKRTISQSLSTSQILARIYGAHRLDSQVHVTRDSLAKHWTSVRIFTDTHSTSDAVVKTYQSSRRISDNLTPSSTAARTVHFYRAKLDSHAVLESLLRSAGPHRIISQALSTSDALSMVRRNHPRVIGETLTHSDGPLYTLIGPILGRLWYDPVSQIFYDQLPDWEFIIGSSHPALDGLYYAPKTSPSINPIREK